MTWYQYRFTLEKDCYDEESAFFVISNNENAALNNFLTCAKFHGWLDNDKGYKQECLFEVEFDTSGSWCRKFSDEYKFFREQLVTCVNNDDFDAFVDVKLRAKMVLSESEMLALENFLQG